MSAVRVDAHQHFWRLARGDYRWLTPDLTALYRDFEPRDLAPLLARCGIDRTVLVQAADSVEETRFLLRLARETPCVAGVVGWIDMQGRDAAGVLDELAGDPRLVGIRPMLQDLNDERWILRADVEPALRALVKRKLVFDALVKPQHLPHVRELMSRHSDLRVVIDHAAKPEIRSHSRDSKAFQDWRLHMSRLASESRAFVKLSGLATEAGKDWDVSKLRPYVDVLLECFGPERILWGSDWPVIELAGGYESWWRATAELLAGISAKMRDAVLGQNAVSVYRLAIAPPKSDQTSR